MTNVPGPGAMSRMTLKRNVCGWGTYGIVFLVNGGGLGHVTNSALDTYMRDRSWAENAQYDRDPSAPLLNGITLYASAALAGLDTVTGRLNMGTLSSGQAVMAKTSKWTLSRSMPRKPAHRPRRIRSSKARRYRRGRSGV